MNILLLKVSLLTCLLFGSSFVDAIEPVTTGVAVGVAFVSSAFIAGFDLLKCTFYECCDAQWITPNITGSTPVLIIAFSWFWLTRTIANSAPADSYSSMQTLHHSIRNSNWHKIFTQYSTAHDLRATSCHGNSLTETRWHNSLTRNMYVCVYIHVSLFAYGLEFCSLKYLIFVETSIL